MEYNRIKRKGSGNSTKVKPNLNLPSSMVVNQDHLISTNTPPKQMGYFPPTSTSTITIGSVEYQQQQKSPVSTLSQEKESSRFDAQADLDHLYGFTVDESVDAKAATYISTVRDRFIKLQPLNSELHVFQDLRITH
ncbi:hypothetical protein ACH5RR_010934 [Cinchona calisaya]|uniref:Uncharacterized protein n=1 Tax=Cinchona calisaya TaxID=153742 RepID=A0ABD3A998_9GENT